MHETPGSQNSPFVRTPGDSNQPLIRLKRLPFNTLPLPTYATAGAAAFDLCACLIYDELTHSIAQTKPHELTTVIYSDDAAVIRTGFAIALPEDYELQIRPRSGFSTRKQTIILNSPGTIDADYRGEILISLKNLGSEPVVLRHGDRIAQAVLAPVLRPRFEEVTELDVTERNTGGFGSTGA